MRLNYKVSTRDGKIVNGLIDANTVNEAAFYLRSKGFFPIEIKKQKQDILAILLPMFSAVKTSDVILFTRQISSMLASGLTLLRALNIFKEQISNKVFLDIISKIVTDIEGGKNFAQALERYPDVFSPIYIALIKAGEKSGLLDKVLLRLADNMEKEDALKSSLRSALIYPIIIIGLMLIVVVVMSIFVIPTLSGLYKGLNVPLPLPTIIIIGLSHFIINFWWTVIVGVVLAGFLYRLWKKTDPGKLIIDSVVLKIPIFGKITQESILTEFSRTLGLLIGTGVLVVDALNQTATMTGNIHYETAIKGIAKQVEKGVAVGEAMSSYKLFPQLLVQLVKVGEQTGKIDETLTKASQYFGREVDEAIKTLTSAMEPIIIIMLGVGVAILIISIIMPIYSLISSIQ